MQTGLDSGNRPLQADRLAKSERIFLLLIGFFSTTEVIALGFIGNTPVSPAVVCSIVYLGYLLFKRRGVLHIAATPSVAWLLVFWSCALISACAASLFSSQHWSYAPKSLMVLGSGLIVYLATICSPSQETTDVLVRSLVIGGLVNAAYGIYQYFGSYRGFPILTIGSLANTADVALLHRAQGFFREPSYFAGFLVPCMFLAYGGRGSRWIFRIGFMSSALLFSFSSGAVMIVFAMVLYIISQVLYGVTHRNGHRENHLLVFSQLAVVALLSSVLLVPQVRTGISTVLAGAHVNAAENAGRVNTILKSIGLAMEHPFGVGYGTGPSFMASLGEETKIHSLFSGILLDLGLPGITSFMLFVLSGAIPLLGSKTLQTRMIAVAAITTMLYSFATYNGIFYFQWVLWGLASQQLYQVRRQGHSSRLAGKKGEFHACAHV